MRMGNCTNASVVRYHNAFKSPFASQQVIKKPLIGMARLSVIFHISNHHRCNLSLLYSSPKRHKIGLTHRSFAHIVRRKIETAKWLPRSPQMLNSDTYMVLTYIIGITLHTAYNSNTHSRSQIRILTISFLSATIPWVASQIKIRRERKITSSASSFASNNLPNFSFKIYIP